MNISAPLFAILIALPPFHSDRDEENRDARMRTIAASLDRGARKATCESEGAKCSRIWPGSAWELATLAGIQGWWESRYARHVHAGKCRLSIGECDAFKIGPGRFVARAASPWQVQTSGIVPIKEWRKLAGTDQASTDRAAWAAIKVLAHARSRCGETDWPTGAVSMYATGKHCRWKGAARRVAHWRRVQ